ncbi:MAG: iron-sulfur cluster assembly scaffold protein [Lysobacter sp.]
MSDHDSAMEVLYQALKEYAPQVRRDRRLQVPPAQSVSVHSDLCGSKLTLDAVIVDGRLKDIGYRVRSCSLGQATTAITARRAIGMDAQGIATVHAQLEQLLSSESGSSVKLDWPELEIFSAIRKYGMRHGSVLLPFVALEKLFTDDKLPVTSST